MLLGFAATAIVIGPAGVSVELGALLALTAAVTYALMTLSTRYIGHSAIPSVMALVSMLVFVLGSGLCSIYVAVFWSDVATVDPALLFLLRPWRMPMAEDLALMVTLGVIATFGFYYLTKAYWIAPISVVAPFEYSYIIWAVGFGYFIWNEIPAVTTLIGLSLLTGSSLYILHREVRAAKPGDDRLIAARTNIPADADQRIEPEFDTAFAENLSPHTARRS